MPSTKNQAETSLSDLALTELGDRLPGLISYLLGFELLSADDKDYTRAAGVLGFDVNGQRVLIPVLFLNGRVRGMEIMYLSDTDTFVSATPQWVEYITTRSSGITGEADPQGKTVGTVPSQSLAIFNRPPQIAKRAALDDFSEWCSPEKAVFEPGQKSRFLEALAGMGKHAYVNFMADLVSHPELFSRVLDYYEPEQLKLAEFKEASSLSDIAKGTAIAAAGGGLGAAAGSLASGGALPGTVIGGGLGMAVANGVNAYMGLPAFGVPSRNSQKQEMRQQYRQLKKKQESGQEMTDSDIASLNYLENELYPQKKLAFITASDLEADPQAFDLPTKLDVMANGMAVIDKRAADEKSEFYTDDYSRSFNQVTESGPCSMINQRGVLRDVIVAHNPFSVNRLDASRDGDFVFDPQTGVHYDSRVGEPVLVRPRKSDSQDVNPFETWRAGLPAVTSAKPNTNYVLVGPGGEMSRPFKVTQRSTSGGKTVLSVGSYDSCCVFSCYDTPKFSKPTAKSITVAGEGAGIKHIGDTLVVGDDWRVWSVADEPKGFEAYDKRSEERQALKPAGLTTIMNAQAANGILELGVSKKAGRYIVSVLGANTPTLEKNACLRVLTSTLGIDAQQAIDLVESTQPDSRSRAWFKRADIYSGMPFPDMQTETGANDLGVRETQGMTSSTIVPMQHEPFPDPFNPDLANYDKIKQKDIDFLMRAADSGSQNVFDPAMIGVLLKTNRTLIQVDQWVPDLVTALDRLCRTLLLFYWKNPDFSHGYGTDEMAELEDVMLNVIKSLGTIVLFFKQRASESPGTKIDAFSGN